MSSEKKSVSEMSVPELCEEFRNEILYDAHGLLARVRRSRARRELGERGRSVLAEIATYLTEKAETLAREGEVIQAWGLLLCWFFDEASSEWQAAPQNLPKNYEGLQPWILWARQHAGTLALVHDITTPSALPAQP